MSKMPYDDFKSIINKVLKGSPKGLTWSEIRQKQPKLCQKFPANQWVRKLETDIGLIRERIKGKTMWRLK
jgi:hypothetical protein